MGKELAESLEPPVPESEIAAETPEQETPEAEAKPPEEPKAEEPKQEKVVPLAALHEERQRRKELQAEIQRERQERAAKEAVIQDRLNQMWQAQNPGPQFRDPEKDPDPLAALAHNQQLTVRQMQEFQQQRQVEEAQKRQAQQTQQLVEWARFQAGEFVKEAPDFGDAYTHLLNVRRGELEAMGMQPHEVKATLEENELWIYHSAAQRGGNPADMIYKMAKAAGYTGKKEPAPDANEQKLATLQKGVAASKTLASPAANGKPTAEQIANMTDEEFAEFKKTLKRGQTLSDVL